MEEKPKTYTIREIQEWGSVLDSKVTGLYADQGHICPLCGEDAGEGPLRLNFESAPDGSMRDYYFHLKCASQLINSDGTFFSQLGPEVEDGPWAEGYSERAQDKLLAIPYVYLNAGEVKELQEHVKSTKRWNRAYWGNCGPSGTCTTKYKPLADLETDHLEAILITQPQIEPWLRATILELLKERWDQTHS